MEISTSYAEEVIEGTENVRVTIKDLALSTIVGVNPPEREAKQRVITTVIVHGKPGHGEPIDYASLVTRIADVNPHPRLAVCRGSLTLNIALGHERIVTPYP